MSFESHNYAVSIEWTVRDVFNCDRFGFGGVADADFIESSGGMYVSMACALATIYNDANLGHKALIDEFLNSYGFCSDKRIVEIIKENGKEEVEKIISEFKNLMKS